MKNSSRFEPKMERNLTRSKSGCLGSHASSSTRRLNSSHDNSRLMYSEDGGSGGEAAGAGAGLLARPAPLPAGARAAGSAAAAAGGGVCSWSVIQQLRCEERQAFPASVRPSRSLYFGARSAAAQWDSPVDRLTARAVRRRFLAAGATKIVVKSWDRLFRKVIVRPSHWGGA